MGVTTTWIRDLADANQRGPPHPPKSKWNILHGIVAYQTYMTYRATHRYTSLLLNVNGTESTLPEPETIEATEVGERIMESIDKAEEKRAQGLAFLEIIRKHMGQEASDFFNGETGDEPVENAVRILKDMPDNFEFSDDDRCEFWAAAYHWLSCPSDDSRFNPDSSGSWALGTFAMIEQICTCRRVWRVLGVDPFSLMSAAKRDKNVVAAVEEARDILRDALVSSGECDYEHFDEFVL